MNTESLKNVCVVPYTFDGQLFAGGIESGANCELGRITGGKNPRDKLIPRPNISRHMRGRYLYAGPLWNHFGHTLVDSIHRLWALDGHDAIVFSGVTGLRKIFTYEDLQLWKIPDFVTDILDLMGVKAPVYLVRDATTFEHLDVPEAGAVWKNGVKPEYRTHLARYQDRIKAQISGLSAPEKIYYSRSHQITDGMILGSSYFEEELSKNGFTSIRPEDQSIKQQFANMLLSKKMVFDEGSAVHLSEPLNTIDAEFFMIPRRSSDNVFSRALQERGSFSNVAPGQDIVSMKDRNGAMSTAALCFYRNPRFVVERLEKLGLITTQFNPARYAELEELDLKRCKAKDVALREERIRDLSKYRQENPVI